MDVVLCWHMHQPDYRLDGVYQKPWTWLHAVKDYTDMAAHLENVPGARAVVNFSGVLIEQLRDYPRRIRDFLNVGKPIGDPLLDALASAQPGDNNRRALIEALTRVNESQMKSRFGPYSQLFDRAKAELAGEAVLRDQEITDLIVWYVLVWLGESLHALPPVQKLLARECNFTGGDRRNLLQQIAETIEGILPRYAKLAAEARVELSVSPFTHPILPLMLDPTSAREAMPDVALPPCAYPGGRGRCEWQLAEARRVFAEAFGQEPSGCWPSEGGLSEEALDLIQGQGFAWTASGSQVLRNSLGDRGLQVPQLRPWSLTGSRLACFFRDDELSDLIGFEYSAWDAREATDHFLRRLEQRRGEFVAGRSGSRPVLSIIMDGENAWEYYPENAWSFLQALYSGLAGHPELNLTTFSDVLERTRPQPLERLCAGSWVHGTFSTWVGDAAKNRAWAVLCDAKSAVDAALEHHDGGDLPDWANDILRQLAICEASDWFWWLGEDNQLRDGPEFDALFRKQLQLLYQMIGTVPPDVLDHPLDDGQERGGAAESEASGAMRRSSPC